MKKVLLLLILFFQIFASNISKAQSTYTGVTVITHGFNPTGDFGWLEEQAKAILDINGGGYIYKNDIDTGLWKEIPYQGGNTKTHIVLIYDWAFSSWQTKDGNLEGAADNLFGMLMDCPNIEKNLFWSTSIHKHFIGHSRGAVLLTQLFHRVSKANAVWKIQHFTSLDPHPATPMLDQALPYVFKELPIVSQNQRYYLQIPSNVIKADNYYRTDAEYEGLSNWGSFDGVRVQGSQQIRLNETVINSPNCNLGPDFGGSHSKVHMWYFGTTKTNAITSEGCDIPSNWYGGTGSWRDYSDFSAVSRVLMGYNNSQLGGLYFALPNATYGLPSNDTPTRVYNNRFVYQQEKDLLGKILTRTPGWEKNGGRTKNVTFPNLQTGAMVSTAPESELKHSIMLIPLAAAYLTFKAKCNCSGINQRSVQTKFYNSLLNSQAIPYINPLQPSTTHGGKYDFQSVNSFETVKIVIPASIRGKAGTFSFSAIGNSSESITFDNIGFLDENSANLRVSAEQSTQTANTLYTYYDFPVTYNVNPNPLLQGTQPTSFNATVTNSLPTTWSGTLTMTWRNVNDTGRGIQLATQNVTLAPNATVTLDRGTQQIISTAGEYVLSIYANNDTSPIDRYYYYVNEPPIVPATVINIETPTSVSFGSVNVGGSFDKIITIKNASTSNAVLTGTIAPVSGVDMSIISGSQTLNLAPNQSQDITVRFSPLSGGVYNNSLSISGNFNGTSKSISLTGTGVTVLPTLTYSRATGQTYSLLDAQMGNFSDAIISVSNYSSTAFSGSFAVTGNGYSGFIVGGSGSNLNIPAGGSQNITVRFTPTANGISTGSLNITGSATNTPATFNFSTLGTGFPTSGCVTSNIITKTSVVDISYTGWREFGRFTLTNTSSTLPANITNFKIGGSDASKFRVVGYQNTTFSLNAGESREFVVDINPISTQGSYSGIMIVGSGAIGAGCNLNIDLRGTPSSPSLLAPELIAPLANNQYAFTGFAYGFYLQFRKINVTGLATYKVYLMDLTANQILFDYYDAGLYTSYNPTAQCTFQTDNGVSTTVKGITGHQYAWKVRAESVSNPNVYTDSELRYFTVVQPPLCTAPTDFSITDITKNSALITWNAVPSAYTYNLQTSIDNGVTYTGILYNLAATQATITSLANSALYRVRIVSNCGQGSYNINEYTRSQPSINKPFTTLADCSTLTSSITPNTAQTICQGSSVNLTSSVGSSYKWYKNDVLITGATNQIYAAGQAGTYKVKVLYANGCEVVSNAVSITEIIKPQITVSTSASGICPNGSVSLSTTQISGTTYQWIKDGVNIANSTSNTLTAVSSGVYKLAYTQNGCTFNSDLINVPVLPTPTIYITGNNSMTVGSTMNLSAFGASTYSWSGVPNFTSTANNVSIQNMQLINAGNYTLVGTGSNGCISTINFSVTVLPAVCTQMYTLSSGNWNTLSIWSCGRTPLITDDITISSGHIITISSGQTGFLNGLKLNGNLINNGRLKYKEL